jgi:hypothetical protein
MTAQRMCSWVRKAASDWPSDVAAIGYPGPAVHGRPVHEPYNMSKGWVGFDYAKGLGCPVKLSALQERKNIGRLPRLEKS